jgi:hypothetical protein
MTAYGPLETKPDGMKILSTHTDKSFHAGDTITTTLTVTEPTAPMKAIPMPNPPPTKTTCYLQLTADVGKKVGGEQYVKQVKVAKVTLQPPAKPAPGAVVVALTLNVDPAMFLPVKLAVETTVAKGASFGIDCAAAELLIPSSPPYST